MKLELDREAVPMRIVFGKRKPRLPRRSPQRAGCWEQVPALLALDPPATHVEVEGAVAELGENPHLGPMERYSWPRAFMLYQERYPREGHGLTYRELGEQHGITATRVRQLALRAQLYLRREVQRRREISDKDSLHILVAGGDSKLMWDPENEAEVAAAQRIVEKLREEGYVFFLIDGSPAPEAIEQAYGVLNCRRIEASEVVQPRRRGRPRKTEAAPAEAAPAPEAAPLPEAAPTEAESPAEAAPPAEAPRRTLATRNAVGG